MTSDTCSIRHLFAHHESFFFVAAVYNGVLALMAAPPPMSPSVLHYWPYPAERTGAEKKKQDMLSI